MADSKVTGLGAITDYSGADVEYLVDGASADAKILAGDKNLLPDGTVWNGYFQVTVASNNITVALKTRSGNNPSLTEPVTVFIGGARRRITAALSVTKNAGTNWFGSGSSAFATLERDYFVYLIWNTTPATDIVDLGFSPIPYGRLYSDFSSTTTAEKYLAHANASDPAAGDECVNIGRFAATLSASASFNWSVPTFTAANLVNFPCLESRWLTYAPTLAGFSANPTNTIYEYMMDSYDCVVRVRQATNGTSNGTSFTISSPFTAKTVSNGSWVTTANAVDNGAALTGPVLVFITNGTSTITLNRDLAGAAWTNVNGKRVGYFELRFLVG